MAKTAQLAITERISIGGTRYLYVGTIKPDSEYETGGDTLTQPTTGIQLPAQIDYFATAGGGGGYHPQYKPSTGKVVVFTGEASGSGKGGKEVAAKADLSAETFTFICIGA